MISYINWNLDILHFWFNFYWWSSRWSSIATNKVTQDFTYIHIDFKANITKLTQHQIFNYCSDKIPWLRQLKRNVSFGFWFQRVRVHDDEAKESSHFDPQPQLRLSWFFWNLKPTYNDMILNHFQTVPPTGDQVVKYMWAYRGHSY